MIRTATSCVVVALLALTSLRAPVASAQEDLTSGLRAETRQFVEVDLAATTLRVRHEVTLTNELPNRTSGDFVERFYFPSFTLPVYRGATALSAVQDNGRSLPVSTVDDASGLVSFATVDLQPDLYYGQTRSFVLTYEMPTQPPRTGSLAQVNAALATFPLLLSGDPGLASVEVRVPAGEEIEVVGDALERRVEGDTVVLSASAVADPAEWFSTVLVRDDDALVQREVLYGPHRITLQGWPGDDEWLASTEDLAARGLPALQEVIGYGWGTTREIDIVETVAPYVYGFAGWYQSSGTDVVIEVGDRLDAHVTLHELAHSWFDSSTFEGRWLNEALADETAALALADLGMERPTPLPTAPTDLGALPLLEWEDPDLANPESEDQEAYGYNASWWIAHQLSQEIGAESLREVLVTAHDGRSGYDTSDLGTIDWREMLDLFEDVGGSDQADELWQTFVLDESGRQELSDREAARDEYGQLVELGDGWLPPAVLREQMASWDFDAAADTGGEVRDLFAQRDDVADDFAAWELELPESLREQFEGADDTESAGRALSEADSAAVAVQDAEHTIETSGWLADVGLLFEDPSEDVDAALVDLEAGAWTQAERHAELAVDAVDAAETDGILRLAGVAGLVLLAAYVARRLWVHRRRARAT